MFYQDPHPCSLSGTHAHRSAAQSPACSPRSSYVRHPHRAQPGPHRRLLQRAAPAAAPARQPGQLRGASDPCWQPPSAEPAGSIRLSRFGASAPNSARLDSATASNDRIASSTGFELCNGIRSGSLVRGSITTLPGHRAQCRELRRRPGQVDGPHSGPRAAWLAVIPTRQVPVRAARRPASARCGAGDQLARPIEGVFTWQSPRLLRPVR